MTRQFHWHSLSFVGAALLGLTVAACVGASTTCTPLPPQTICAPLRTWNVAEQQAGLLEYTSLPPKAQLRQFMLDYESMRDASRACRGMAPAERTL